MTTYELRRDGRVWVSSPVPDCGYDRGTLRSLREHGFRLYKVEAPDTDTHTEKEETPC